MDEDEKHGLRPHTNGRVVEVSDEAQTALATVAADLAAMVHLRGQTELEAEVVLYDEDTGMDLGGWTVTVIRTREPSGGMSEHAAAAGRA